MADEVYRGAERETDDETPSFYGRYDKVLAVGSMSKAYGLPGLRVGWAHVPPEMLPGLYAARGMGSVNAFAQAAAEAALDDLTVPSNG